ncbi:MAG: type II secretion system protein, partial [Brevundimonas sp.]|nr:type II secretion system protein [Brevundimonas sp.]
MRRPTLHLSFTAPRGFTLLEVLVVLTILGFLAAMIVPAVGMLDDLERERRTRERMDQIRDAILGPEGRFDEQGRPIIGGYVGDMRNWPDLWEARAELRPSGGADWNNPDSLHAGLGQGPTYTMDPEKVFFRPSGTFSGGRWKWHT